MLNLINEMKNCQQTEGQSVWNHGESVWNYYQDLINYIKTGKSEFEWRIPDWFETNKNNILENQHSFDTIKEYTIFHDCGKPFCKEIDEDGKSHFPNHAEVSKNVYLETFGNKKVADLIGWDMSYHILNADEINDHCDNVWSKEDALTLLFVSFSEIHSNASMFGGINSVSFKSKWKKIDRRGKAVCKKYFGE